MDFIRNTLIGLTITLAAVKGLSYIVYTWGTNKPTMMPYHGDHHEDNRMITAAAAGETTRTDEKFDGNVSIVWKDKSFLVIMIVFTCFGYIIRILPFGVVFHLVFAITGICAILRILSKDYMVTVNWLHGNIYISAEIQMSLLPKFKFSRSYTFMTERTQ